MFLFHRESGERNPIIDSEIKRVGGGMMISRCNQSKDWIL